MRQLPLSLKESASDSLSLLSPVSSGSTKTRQGLFHGHQNNPGRGSPGLAPPAAAPARPSRAAPSPPGRLPLPGRSRQAPALPVLPALPVGSMCRRPPRSRPGPFKTPPRLVTRPPARPRRPLSAARPSARPGAHPPRRHRRRGPSARRSAPPPAATRSPPPLGVGPGPAAAAGPAPAPHPGQPPPPSRLARRRRQSELGKGRRDEAAAQWEAAVRCCSRPRRRSDRQAERPIGARAAPLDLVLGPAVALWANQRGETIQRDPPPSEIE